MKKMPCLLTILAILGLMFSNCALFAPDAQEVLEAYYIVYMLADQTFDAVGEGASITGLSIVEQSSTSLILALDEVLLTDLSLSVPETEPYTEASGTLSVIDNDFVFDLELVGGPIQTIAGETTLEAMNSNTPVEIAVTANGYDVVITFDRTVFYESLQS